MSFLSAEEAASLKIKQVILHVVGGKEEFKPQPVLTDFEQGEFFLSRILDVAISGVHRFEEKSATKTLLGQIANGATPFEAGAQELSRLFSKDHVGSSRNGAFFIFDLRCDEPTTRIFSLIKYDYQEAIELYTNEGRNNLRSIVQAFVRQRRAMQKACFVRCTNGSVEQNVSAFDRMGDAPDLTDYFQRFLEVVRDRDTSELSARLNEVLRCTIQNGKSHLPDQDVPKALIIAKEALRGRDSIDEDGIREAIHVAADRPDEAVRADLDKILDQQLREKRLSGVTLGPTKTSSAKRLVYAFRRRKA